MELISAHIKTEARESAAAFNLWVQPNTWPVWDPGVKAVDFSGVGEVGKRGKLWPQSGPATTFQFVEIVPKHLVVTASTLPGVRILFEHEVTESEDGLDLTVRVCLVGLLAPLWKLILAKPLSEAANHGLTGLSNYLNDQS